MIPKATIETLREGEELIVRARYWTPEWVRFVETIWWPLTLMGWAGLSIAAFRGLAASDLAATANEALFWSAIASASVFAISWAVNRMLVRIGGGYGLARIFGPADVGLEIFLESACGQQIAEYCQYG